MFECSVAVRTLENKLVHAASNIKMCLVDKYLSDLSDNLATSVIIKDDCCMYVCDLKILRVYPKLFMQLLYNKGYKTRMWVYFDNSIT